MLHMELTLGAVANGLEAAAGPGAGAKPAAPVLAAGACAGLSAAWVAYKEVNSTAAICSTASSRIFQSVTTGSSEELCPLSYAESQR